jgi:hypothetical protein
LKRTVVIATLLIGCSSKQANVECGPGTADQNGVCVVANVPPVAPAKPAPPPDPLVDIKVEVIAKDRMLALKVSNGQSAPIKVDWDASSYVGGNGVSLGRLIKGTTRRFQVGQPQPATPIAPGAMLSEIALSEAAANANPDDVLAGPFDDPRAAVHLAIITETGSATWKGIPLWPLAPFKRTECVEQLRRPGPVEVCTPGICTTAADSNRIGRRSGTKFFGPCSVPPSLFCFPEPTGSWSCHTTLERCSDWRGKRLGVLGMDALECSERPNVDETAAQP